MILSEGYLPGFTMTLRAVQVQADRSCSLVYTCIIAMRVQVHADMSDALHNPLATCVTEGVVLQMRASQVLR